MKYVRRSPLITDSALENLRALVPPMVRQASLTSSLCFGIGYISLPIRVVTSIFRTSFTANVWKAIKICHNPAAKTADSRDKK